MLKGEKDRQVQKGEETPRRPLILMHQHSVVRGRELADQLEGNEDAHEKYRSMVAMTFCWI